MSEAIADVEGPRPIRIVPVAYLLVMLAVLVNLLDAWIYPSAGFDSGGIKVAGLRVTDLLCLISLGFSAAKLVVGQIRLPSVYGVPMALAVFVWILGLVIGLANHHNGRVIFAECHVLLYLAAVGLAWLDAPPKIVARHESVLPWIALIAALTLVRSTSTEKGSDLSTIIAGIAAIWLVRPRPLLGIAVAVTSFLLIITGGQRAAVLFSLPPLILGAIIAMRHRRISPLAAAWSSLVAAVAIAISAPFWPRFTTSFQHIATFTFTRTAKLQSTNSRREQWAIAVKDIKESPWFGHGLGFRYQLFDPTTGTTALTDITHNIYLDILLRFGFVGAGLLAFALLLCLAKVIRIHARLDATQGVILLSLVGLLGKGVVESVMDKPRLALFAAWLAATLMMHGRLRNERDARAANLATPAPEIIDADTPLPVGL
jgi:O-Antigen ligase